MPYYQGDFYTGDFYRGDPFFGALLGRVARFGMGLLTGASGGGKIAKAAPAAAGLSGAAASAGRAIVTRVGGMVAKHPVLSAAGAAGTIGVLGGMGAGRMMAPNGMVSHKGYHIEKKGKHAGQWIKNRHMNVCNPRALRRAIRRAHGFSRLAMRTIHLIHPKKKVRFAGFRKRRRSK